MIIEEIIRMSEVIKDIIFFDTKFPQINLIYDRHYLLLQQRFFALLNRIDNKILNF